MNQTTEKTETFADRMAMPRKTVTITREYAAPRTLVFKAWTDPKQVAQWWGPRCFDNPVCQWDARVGGAIKVHMRGPDGAEHPMGGKFLEIDEPHRLVFTTTAFFDAQGVPQLETHNTVTFSESNGKTTMTMEAIVIKSTPELAGPLSGMHEGWSQSLDKLGELLARG